MFCLEVLFSYSYSMYLRVFNFFILNRFLGIGKHGKNSNIFKPSLPNWEENEIIVDRSKL